MGKIDELIEKLTLKEKIALVTGYKSWMTHPINRLNIPSIYLTDGPIGVRKQSFEKDEGGLGLGKSYPSTSFPTAVNIANSWNNKNAYYMGKAIGEECEIYDVNVLLGPGMNIKRDPRCGRNFEYYSEDPLLAGLMAGNFISGVQSNNVAACMKHYAANNSENFRYMGSSCLDERALKEIYLKPFEIATRVGKPKACMCAYNQINGTHCSEYKWLINTILRRQYGFNGVVMTDWGATKDRVKGIEAGIDLDMPGGVKYNSKRLLKAIKNKELKEKDLNYAVKNILNLVYSFKENKEFKEEEKQKIFNAHNRLALNIALDSAVLLKNSNNILPLNKNKKVLIVGNLFEYMRYQGAGSSLINPYMLTTCKDAFDKAKVNYEYVLGYKESENEVNVKLEEEAINKAKDYDLVLFFGGLTELAESEGHDRENLSLPNNQLSLINKLANLTNVVAVMFGGSPFEMPFNNKVKAILNMFLPGQAGGEATYKLLYGLANPSGKLSETWMKSVNDIPFGKDYSKNYLEKYKENIYVGYRYYDENKEKVLYPFGYGLSYSNFTYAYKTMKLENNTMTIKVDVTNNSNFSGSEVLQLYVGRNKDSKVFKPFKELKAYEKIFLKPNETKEVELTFKTFDVTYFNTKENRFIIENGTYPIYIATSSNNIIFEKEFVIAGKKEFESPYSEKVNNAYKDIKNLNNISDEIFNETILNKKIDVLNNTPFTMETQLEKFRETKHGQFVLNLILKVVTGKTKDSSKIKDESIRVLMMKNRKFITDLIPKNNLRSLVQSSGGMLQMNQAKALLQIANGHKFKAILELFK